MQIGSGDFTYTWIENWARIPDTPSGRINGRTHGAAVLPDGRVIVFCQSWPGVLFFDPSGQLIDSWGDRFLGAHGLELTRDRDGQDVLMLVDQTTCEVCKVTLGGELIQRYEAPPITDRPGGKYVPTWATLNKSNGDVWVGDGYGGDRVYRYDGQGKYVSWIDGSEGGKAFQSPHAVKFSPEGELWITDRSNHRIAIYDADGKLLRDKQHLCHSPSDFAFHDGLTYVPELFTGIKIITPDLEVVADLGSNPQVKPHADLESWWPPQAPEGWPDLAGTEHIRPGVFNSPHGIAVDPNTGDIIVVEWIIGGRITRLVKS